MDDKQEAILMFRNGVDVPVIAEELNTSTPTVYRWLEESGSVQDVVQERNALIAAAYQQDWPIHKICTKFDVSQGTVYRTLHSAEIPLRRKQRTSSAEDDEAIVLMYEGGLKIAAIKTRTGRSLTYIYDTLERLEIPLRRGGARIDGSTRPVVITPIPTPNEPAPPDLDA